MTNFCLENGYTQTGYHFVIPGGDRQLLDLDGLEVQRERQEEPNDLVLNIVSEVSCIFYKPVRPCGIAGS